MEKNDYLEKTGKNINSNDIKNFLLEIFPEFTYEEINTEYNTMLRKLRFKAEEKQVL